MEDALALISRQEKRNIFRVLILVLMEDALALKAQVKEQMRQFGVLILVLMEDALAQVFALEQEQKIQKS